MLHKLAALFTLATAVASAQGTAGTSTSESRSAARTGATTAVLDSIARLALDRNLNVRRAGERRAEADAGVREARGRLLPSVGVEARYTESNGAIDIGDFINPAYRALNELTGTSNFPTNVSSTLPLRQETRLRLVMPLFNGALYANVSGAGAIRDLREAELGAARRRLDAEARIAWLDWARAVRAVEVLEAAIITLEENVRVSQRCVDAGTATPDAVLRARAELAEAVQHRAEGARLREAARGAVNLILDQPDDTPLALKAEDVPGATNITLDAALAASSRREEHRMAAAAAVGARAQGRAATSGFLPSVGVALDYGVQGDKYNFSRNHDVAMASVVFSWNVFNGGQDVARRQAADAAFRGAGLRASEVDAQVALDVRTAWDAVQVARQSVETAATRVAAAGSAFNLIDRRYAEGLASHIEWSDARTQLTSAQLNQVMTRYLLAARGIELERAAALRDIPNE